MVNIRRAAPDDAASLACLAERTFRDTYTANNDPSDMDFHCQNNFNVEIQHHEILEPNYVTILAEMGTELVAFAQVKLHSPKQCIQAEHPSELYRLYVSNEWHGRGVAHEVMTEVLAVAAGGEADHLWLSVWEQNPKAIAFYRKYGFKVVGNNIFQVGADPQQDLIMAVELAGQLA
ncbi:MAG: N-acetyltransferase [Pseudomonadota bacterium]